MVVQNHIDLGTVYPTNLAAWANNVAWTEAASRDNVVPQAVRVYTVGGSGPTAVRTVATVASGMQVAFVSGDGSNVVFLVAKITNNAATWTIRLVDLTSGHSRDIASSPVATPPGIVPHPVIRDHWIAWAEVTDANSGSSRAVVYDLTTGSRRTLGTNDPAFVAIDGPTLYFDGSDAAGRDVFAVPLDQRGPVQQLTHSGAVVNPRAGDGYLVWQEPLSGDPQSVWAADDRTPAAAAHPVELDNTRNNGDPAPGMGFAAWLDGLTRLVVRSVGGTQVVPVPNQDHLSVAARWAAAGRTLAWVNDEGADQSDAVLYVGTVTG